MRSLEDWLRLQEQVHPQTIDMGLARVSAVARALGLERSSTPVITVAGTNGKGSVCALLEALLAARGARVGLFTSPHLVRYNERIRVGGAEVSDIQLIDAFERIEAARGDTTLTFFEYNTLAALWLSRALQVEFTVLEVGLGGRLDATNLIDADVAVLASVGFDHRDWLGDTLDAIGAEKAGIFRPGRPAVLGTPDMPASVFGAIGRLGARAVVAGRDFTWQVHGDACWDYAGLQLRLEGLPAPALAGAIQYRNAATALAALEALEGSGALSALVHEGLRHLARPDRARTARALESVQLAGRFQVVPGEVEWILDIAHNEPAARLLAAQLAARALPGPHGRTLAVIGVLKDKDAAAIAAALRERIDHWIACALPGPRGGSAAELLSRLALPPGTPADLCASVAEGCARARRLARPGDRVLVCGSLHTVGPALEWLRI